MTKPATDWNAIRALINAAIDACEVVDHLGIAEDESSAIAWRTPDGVEVSIADFLTSAWTYPEIVERELLRLRHRLNADAPYVDPLARTLVHVARAAAQLVGARAVMRKNGSGGRSLRTVTTDLSAWYTHHFASRLAAHAGRRRSAKRPKMSR